MAGAVYLVIPIFNEADSISALFDALEPLLTEGVIHRVIVGDNGSTDGSQDLARSRGAVVVEEPRRGYGAACLAAIRWIKENATDPEPEPTAIAFVDADLSDDPTRLKQIIDALDECDLVLGSRQRLAQKGALNLPQRWGGRLATALIFLTTGKRYGDLGPMRAIRCEAYRRLGMCDQTWGWTVEMQMKAAMFGMRTMEIDVPYYCRRKGRSKISGTLTGVFNAGIKIIWTIVKIRLTWRG